MIFGEDNKNRGISLIELIIVIAIMGILVGVLSPMFVKYINKSRKAKDVYTADQIARAVNIAFIENQEANDAFNTFKGKKVRASATHNGVTRSYEVYLIASNGKQDTNKVSNCFNGGEAKFYKSKKDGSDGFYGVINRELGLSTTEMNESIIPKYKVKKEGAGVEGRPFAEVDRWRICRRAEDGTLEIWAAQPNPWGGYPIYRVWPQPDDEYTQ
ncbi:MAG: type II secretion system GspH family protein [Lachnospiraceae bacterium]|nr:type II secretion system GspH family protein [Lachnospiraceae bacterium]